MDTAIPLSAPLDELLDAAKCRYDVRFEPVTVGGNTLELLQITDVTALIDRQLACAGDGPVDLPYWATIWPAAMLLAHSLRHLGPPEGRTLLEVGCGIGLVGLFAASQGFSVLLTDIHPDALLFTQINILQNGLADRAGVARADFTADRLGRRFDVIIGAEVLYMQDTYRGLLKFFLAHITLGNDAAVLLSKDFTRKATRFMALADTEFAIAERVVGYKETAPESGQPERKLCQIYRLTPKKIA
ncbi:class I SAM-dependent methyltransferase [Solidesulfovibrio sp.]